MIGVVGQGPYLRAGRSWTPTEIRFTDSPSCGCGADRAGAGVAPSPESAPVVTLGAYLG
jgi:hypothetical protein